MKLALFGTVAAGLAGLMACGGGGLDTPGNQLPSMSRPEPAILLTGRLIDRTTSHPLAHAQVFVQATDGARVCGSAVTQADGSFTVAGLPGGQRLRVVAQPVTGAVAYATGVSEAFTLVQGGRPPKLALALAPITLGGAVEALRPGPDAAFAEGGLTLLHKVALLDGRSFEAVVRTAPEGSGTTRFEALPPGTYHLVFTCAKRGRGPQDPGSAFVAWRKSFKVQAGQTAHADFRWRHAHAATAEAPE